MTDPSFADHLPDRPPIAFVLRLRVLGPAAETVVDVDDVEAAQSWRCDSLDAAFSRIRAAAERHFGTAIRAGRPH